MKKIYSYIGNHPVYDSIYKAFKILGYDVENVMRDRFVIDLYSTYISFRDVIDRPGIHLSHSFLINPSSLWLLRKYPVVFMEERWLKQGFIQRIIREMYRIIYRSNRALTITSTQRSYTMLREIQVDAMLFHPAKERIPHRSGDYILTISKAHPIKRLNLVLDIAERMRDERFVIVARPSKDRDYYEMILRRARSLGNVDFRTEVSEDEKIKLISEAKMLLHTANSGPIEYVIIEALSGSLPVICHHDIGLAPELDQRWVVRGDSIEEWIEKIRSIKDEDYYRVSELFRRYDVEGKIYREKVRELKDRLELLLV
ncbi:MAG: glycosyltransferase [Candidatus Micrarchaeota archaeon]|nr:glycosyltransferase [Candidatus Micrarchaeota archaeon]